MSAQSKRRRQARRRRAPLLKLLAELRAYVTAHGLVVRDGQWRQS